jgi:hypothetical protein
VATTQIPSVPGLCLVYQRGAGAGCAAECKNGGHFCVRCGGSHPVVLCKKDRNVCVKWNMEGGKIFFFFEYPSFFLFSFFLMAQFIDFVFFL